MKFSLLSSNLILSEVKPLNSSFLFECTKSFLLNGHHVHYISKNKVEEIPFTVHGGIQSNVDTFSRLSLKYFKNVDMLLEYACALQYMEMRQSKHPKVIVIQDLEAYFEDEQRGILAIAMLTDALNALGKAFNSPIYLLSGFSCKALSSRSLMSLIDNFFTSTWKLTVENEIGTIAKLTDPLSGSKCVQEIKFRIGEEKIFLEAIIKRG